jgi:hypothetical protein
VQRHWSDKVQYIAVLWSLRPRLAAHQDVEPGANLEQATEVPHSNHDTSTFQAIIHSCGRLTVFLSPFLHDGEQEHGQTGAQSSASTVRLEPGNYSVTALPQPFATQARRRRHGPCPQADAATQGVGTYTSI